MRSWRERLEIAIYRRIKPLTGEREQRELPGDVQASVPELRPRRTILRSKAAALALSFALVGGGGVLLGGYVEAQQADDHLEFVKSSKEEQLSSLQEHRAETDVCMAEAKARAKPEDGIFGVITDPQLDTCYAEQELKVAEINVKAGE